VQSGHKEFLQNGPAEASQDNTEKHPSVTRQNTSYSFTGLAVPQIYAAGQLCQNEIAYHSTNLSYSRH
jgi:hypothetical protein